MKTKTLILAGLFCMAAALFSCSDAKREEMSNHVDEIGNNIDTSAQRTKEDFIREKEDFTAAVNQHMEKNRQA